MKTGMHLVLASAVTAVLVLAIMAGLGLRERNEVASSPSPTPTISAPVAATAPPATATPGSTPSASPSPAGGRYVSALLGYSLELPPPWHRSACSGTVTQQTPTPMGEVFYGVAPRDWSGGDLGSQHPDVRVMAEENPQNLSPRQWAESGRSGATLGERVEDVTYAGRPAARKSVPGGAPTYFVLDRGRMYVVGPGPQHAASPQPTVVRIIESFRFITEAEQAAARAALPTAPPARTPEQVADGVAAAFAAKNAGALAEFAAPCMAAFGEQAGGTTVSRERYLDDLRGAFAAGLVVTVRPRPIEGDRTRDFNVTIQSTWQDARGTVERKLMLRGGVNDRWEWHGTIERFR